jgi:hypothetical protein
MDAAPQLWSVSRPGHRSNWGGLSRNTFQLRLTLDFDSPLWAAIDARDQCVASVGAYSGAAEITASTCSSVIFRGAPGCRSSTARRAGLER